MTTGASHKIYSVTKSSAIFSAGNFLSKAILFVMVPFYSHYILPADMSVLAILDPAEQVMHALLSLGIMHSLFRYYQEGRDPSRRTLVVSTALWFLVAVAIVAGAVLVLFAGPIVRHMVGSHPLARSCYLLAVASLGIRLLNLVAAGYLQVEDRARTIVVWSLVGTVLFCGANIAGLVGLGGGIDIVFWARLVLLAPLSAAGIYAARRWIVFRFDSGLLRRMIAFSSPLILLGTAYPILNFFDRWMLARMLDPAASGIYDISYRFGMIPGMLLVAPFVRVWNPVMYERIEDGSQEIFYRRVLLYYSLVGALLWLGLTVLSSEILTLFSTESYHSGHRIIPWVAASQYFYGLAWIVVAGAAQSGRTLFIGGWTMAGAILNVVLNYWWIPIFGLMGAAYATLVAFVFIFLGFLMYGRSHFPVAWPYGRLAALLGAAVVAGVLLRRIAPESLAAAFAVKIALLVPIAAALAYIAGLTPQKLRWVIEGLRQSGVHAPGA